MDRRYTPALRTAARAPRQRPAGQRTDQRGPEGSREAEEGSRRSEKGEPAPPPREGRHRAGDGPGRGEARHRATQEPLRAYGGRRFARAGPDGGGAAQGGRARED